ncbi:MAG: hypothetical protein ACK5TK_16900 [Betaproteobacteria bacterium]
MKAVLKVPPPPPPLTGEERVIEHPDGFYWLADDDRAEVGPFASFEEAFADMQAAGGVELAPEDELSELESEIGITDWIDPDTGAPAEEARTRLEDH